MINNIINKTRGGFNANDKENIELMKVAYLYYHENCTQGEISDIFGVSKMTVSRMLQRARDKNIVEISVKMPYETSSELEERFVDTFSLKHIVIGRNIADEDIPQFLGKIGGYNFHFHLRNKEVIGVGGSITVGYLVKNLIVKEYEDLKVVQLMGALEENVRPTNSFTITQMLSEKLGGEGYFFSAPAIVDNKKIKNLLLNSSSTYKKVRKLWKICSLALIGIGTVDREATLIKRNFINQKELSVLKNKGAVGDLLGNFFDINGNILNREMQQRILSISQEKLFNMEHLITVAGGLHKTEAILGALRTNAVDILITDETTARAVLALHMKR